MCATILPEKKKTLPITFRQQREESLRVSISYIKSKHLTIIVSHTQEDTQEAPLTLLLRKKQISSLKGGEGEKTFRI